MFTTRTTEDLKEELAEQNSFIVEQRKIGRAWALDSRGMQIAQSRARLIREELRLRGEF